MVRADKGQADGKREILIGAGTLFDSSGTANDFTGRGAGPHAMP